MNPNGTSLQLRSGWTRRIAPLVLVALAAGFVPFARPTSAAETATWVPFVGTYVVSRTYGHSGGHDTPAIDFSMPRGTPIYAGGPGRVTGTQEGCSSEPADGCSGGRGNYVEIAHPDGRSSRYLHLMRGGVVVAVSQQVSRGQLVGYSGNSGHSRGPHLHYDELVNGRRVDPGPMNALHGSSIVSYSNWLASDGRSIRNDGFPRAPTPTPSSRVDSDGDGLWDAWDGMPQRTDVNNDSLPDVVGFANAGVYVALNTGTGFRPASRWIDSFGYTAGGWRVDRHPRMLGGR